MLHLKNISLYTPEKIPAELSKAGVLFFFFRSEDGIDFYDAIKEARDDTVKILYVEGGIITGFSTDASTLYPHGASLVEIPIGEFPEDLQPGGKYIFDAESEKFAVNPAFFETQFKNKKQELLLLANDQVTLYQDKVDIGVATEKEISLLKEWKAYRVKVREATTLDNLPQNPPKE